MARDFDVNEQVQADVDRLHRLSRTGTGDVSPGAALEYTLWTGAALAGIAMVLVMPWVGSGGVVPGEVWLGYSLGAMLFFGGLAWLIRWAREAGDEIDEGMDRRFRTQGGR